MCGLLIGYHYDVFYCNKVSVRSSSVKFNIISWHLVTCDRLRGSSSQCINKSSNLGPKCLSFVIVPCSLHLMIKSQNGLFNSLFFKTGEDVGLLWILNLWHFLHLTLQVAFISCKMRKCLIFKICIPTKINKHKQYHMIIQSVGTWIQSKRVNPKVN